MSPWLVSSLCALFLSLTCIANSVQSNDHSHHSAVVQSDLEKTLKEALKKKQEYVELFKDLTADETMVTEVFDDNGRLKKQRKQIAYFLVYESQLNDQVVNEYRLIIEVDGKPVDNQVERVKELRNKLARAKTLEGEWKRLREENLRYTLKYYRWDITLHPAVQLEENSWPEYNYEVVGHEKLEDRETVVLSYRRKTLYPVKAKGILAEFKDPYVGDQGRLWLDANTFQIRRWENEWVVRHTETGKILVYLRDEVSYTQGDLGILVPNRIVVSFFDKLRYKPKQSAEPRTFIGGRITYTYQSFKRFKVTSHEEIYPIKKD